MKKPGKPEVDAFIFDLFGVIISFDNDIVYRRLANHCADPESAFRRLEGLMASRDVITGQVNLHQIHRRLIDAHGLTLTYPQFETAWLKPYSEPMPGMADLVARLAKNYRLVLLSNVDHYYWEVVQSMHPELECFDSLLVSCDLGLAKPDPEAFLRACRVVGADPPHCFFVDDTQANIDAARELGLQTHRFQSYSVFLKELTQAGTAGI